MSETIEQMTERLRGCHWQQGRFNEAREYGNMPESWIEEQRRTEQLRVRPSPMGNPICHVRRPEDAQWIARRLRDADIFEARVAEQKGVIEEQREAIKRLARQLREAEEREDNLRMALQAQTSGNWTRQQKELVTDLMTGEAKVERSVGDRG